MVARWIDFRPMQTESITAKWEVTTKQGGHLGYVKWYTGWRKYCFFPSVGTLYEQDCLRDLAEFCEQATSSHKSLAKRNTECRVGTRSGQSSETCNVEEKGTQ